MTRSVSRAALSWLAFAALSASCDLVPKPEGRCTGTHLGQSVDWPLVVNSVQSTVSRGNGLADTVLDLNYSPQGQQGLQDFGVDIVLVGEPRFEAGSPRNVKLLPQENRLVPEETSLVRSWEGNLGVTTGYLTPPGVPVEGALTLNQVTPDHAEGQFVYRYSDGGALTCTFDIPDRLYDGGLDSGGGGGFDDDDDD